MHKSLVGCSMFMLILASAPASAMPQQIGNQAAPAAGDQVVASGSGGPSATHPAATPEKKVCKLLPSSYSHMNQRVCLTAKQWEQVERENR